MQMKWKRKRRNLGTESSLTERQKWEMERIVIYSSELRLNSYIKFAVKITKIPPL